jgi:hypothetical protein
VSVYVHEPEFEGREWMTTFWAISWIGVVLGHERDGGGFAAEQVSTPRAAELTPEQSARFETLKRSKPDQSTWTSEDLLRILHPDSPRLKSG